MIQCFRAFLTLPFLLLAVFLTSCAMQSDIQKPEAPLLPGPPPVIDPDDFVLKESILDIMRQTGGPLNSGYTFVRHDLDNDGRRDALVLFRTPYGFWCGTHGCTMLVMKAHNDIFTLTSTIQTVRPPVYVSSYETNGWKNIILRVSGRSTKAKNVAMTFDGTSYPPYPDVIAPVSLIEFETATEIMN